MLVRVGLSPVPVSHGLHPRPIVHVPGGGTQPLAGGWAYPGQVLEIADEHWALHFSRHCQPCDPPAAPVAHIPPPRTTMAPSPVVREPEPPAEAPPPAPAPKPAPKKTAPKRR